MNVAGQVASYGWMRWEWYGACMLDAPHDGPTASRLCLSWAGVYTNVSRWMGSMIGFCFTWLDIPYRPVSLSRDRPTRLTCGRRVGFSGIYIYLYPRSDLKLPDIHFWSRWSCECDASRAWSECKLVSAEDSNTRTESIT